MGALMSSASCMAGLLDEQAPAENPQGPTVSHNIRNQGLLAGAKAAQEKGHDGHNHKPKSIQVVQEENSRPPLV